MAQGLSPGHASNPFSPAVHVCPVILVKSSIPPDKGWATRRGKTRAKDPQDPLPKSLVVDLG